MGRWVDPVLEKEKFTTAVFSIKYKSASCAVKWTLLMKCRAVTAPSKDIPSGQPGWVCLQQPPGPWHTPVGREGGRR